METAEIEAALRAYKPSGDDDRLELMPHQVDGVRFVLQSYKKHGGAIIADEMGLGKTAQACVCIELLRTSHATFQQPDLIICPVSVLPTWKAEIECFAPSARVCQYHGQGRQWPTDAQYNVVLTTYEIALSDAEHLSDKCFRQVILDEVQRLKNVTSATARAIAPLHRHYTLLLTGTPIQNNLNELFALLALAARKEFKHPAVESDSGIDGETFVTTYKDVDKVQSVRDDLRRMLSTIMIRRTKEDVAGLKLPRSAETVILHTLTALQRRLYRAVLMKSHDVIDALRQGDGARSTVSFNNVLVQLRKVAAHPYLIPGIVFSHDLEQYAATGVEPEPFEEGEHLVTASAKLLVLDKMLKRMRTLGHRVLLFSQMTHTLDILQDYLNLRGWPYERLDGSTRAEERADVIKRFNAKKAHDEPFVCLLSTRAGGLGVTLTSADTVIFYDSDFNPQADLQAAARCHRIGQTKPVRVFRLLGQHTVEEVIATRATRKKRLACAVLSADVENGQENSNRVMLASEMRALLATGLQHLDEKVDETDFDSIIERCLGETDRNGCWVLSEADTNKENISEELPDTATIYYFDGKEHHIDETTDKGDEDELQKLVEAGRAEREKRAREANNQSARRLVVSKDLPTRAPRPKLTRQQRRDKWAQEKNYHSWSVRDIDEDNEGIILPNNDCEMRFKAGDVTACAAPSSLIAVVVDNSGEWPRGGVFRNIHADIARQYENAHNMRDLILGHCHVSPAYTSHTRVALLIAQSRRDAINMSKFDEALHRLALYLHDNPSITTVRVPRIGYGIPGITWYSVERTLRKHLCAICEVHVFYYKPQCKRQATPTQMPTLKRPRAEEKDEERQQL